MEEDGPKMAANRYKIRTASISEVSEVTTFRNSTKACMNDLEPDVCDLFDAAYVYSKKLLKFFECTTKEIHCIR